MSHDRRAGRSRERGNALVISLLMLVLITVMGVTLLAVTKTETQISANDMRRSQALYAAEAGVSEGLARMANKADSANYIGEADPGNPTPGWGRYLVLANGNSSQDPDVSALVADTLDNDGDGTIDESGEKYPEVTTKQVGSAIQYPWVRISYKLTAANEVVRYGDDDNNPGTPARLNLKVGAPVLRVAGEGRKGTGLRRLDVEAVKPPGLTTNAALYTEDDDVKFNGTQFLISGFDHDPATGDTIPGASPLPGITTTEVPGNITAGLAGNQVNNVEGEGSNPSVTSSNYDYDLQGIVDTYKETADITHPGGTVGSSLGSAWGGLDEYHTVYVESDLHLSGSVTGGGLLLVNGNFDITGQFTWYGLVVTLGDFKFSGGGAGIHIYGGVMAQGNVSGSSVGGQADIFYSSETIRKLGDANKYIVTRWRED
jgi:Tfp pilus assembly protein PilX